MTTTSICSEGEIRELRRKWNAGSAGNASAWLDGARRPLTDAEIEQMEEAEQKAAADILNMSQEEKDALWNRMMGK